jgi:exopolysaccharide production protein ExoQ
MSSALAALICFVGIGGLFFLDRDKSERISKALWVPVIWLAIVGSRPISAWLGVRPTIADQNQILDGSPLDRVVYEFLLIAGIAILIRRRNWTKALVMGSWPVLIYFLYSLLSVTWSDFPDVSFKRWIKSVGDLVMVLIVVTDANPVAALRRFLARVGFILMPTSILLIKYFGDLGRGYDPGGGAMNTGVTANKNSLGLITFILSLGAFWQVLNLLRAKDQSGRGKRLLAQGILLAFGLALLIMADSATSKGCFLLGVMLMLTTTRPIMQRRPAAVHVLVVMLLIGGGLTMLVGGEADLVHAMGRQTNLTGRTEIWAALIPVAPNAVIGAGFESFWMQYREKRLYSKLPGWWAPQYLNEAHNGYIEVFLELGWVGTGLISLIVLSAYRHAIAVFRRNAAIGCLLLAYVAASAIYSITEAGFRMLSPMWILLLLASFATGEPVPALSGDEPQSLDAPVNKATDKQIGRAYASSCARRNNHRSPKLATPSYS